MKAGLLFSQRCLSAGPKSPLPPLFQRGEILASRRHANLASNAPPLGNRGTGGEISSQPKITSNAPPFEKGGLGGFPAPAQ